MEKPKSSGYRHRHHPHRHQVVVVAEQTIATEQSKVVLPLKNVWL